MKNKIYTSFIVFLVIMVLLLYAFEVIHFKSM